MCLVEYGEVGCVCSLCLLLVLVGGWWEGAWLICLGRRRLDLRICLVCVVLGVIRCGQGRVGSLQLSSCIICGIVASSSPVRVYRRCIFDSWWACACVCRRMGIAPWYMVARLMRSMWRPQLQSSVWVGVLLIIIGWVALSNSGGLRGGWCTIV